MDKTGVPKEAQDDALSDDTTGGRKTPPGRPTRGNVAPMRYFVSFLPSREVETLNFFSKCRTSEKPVILVCGCRVLSFVSARQDEQKNVSF